MLVVARPMMQLDVFFDLDHLPTARAKPGLLLQECSTKRRRRVQRQLAVAVLEVRLPSGVERIGLALDCEIALWFDRCPHPEQLLAAARISAAPRFSRAMGQVGVGEPAPGLVRVTALGPALHPPPNKVVELGEGFTTEHMTVIVRPAPQEGVEGLDELLWRGTPGLLRQGPDLGRESLEAGLARCDLELSPLPSWPLMFASGLS